jgi:flagellin
MPSINNLTAASASRNLSAANAVVSNSVAKLSSGQRIVNAKDDVAGLAIGTSISSTLKTLEISLLNTQQASSVLAIADGALSKVSDILSRQKALSVQANSGSLSNTERGYLNQEFKSLTSEIDRIVGSTSFNGIVLLDGSTGANTAGLLASNAPAAFTTTGTLGSSALDGSTLTIASDNGNKTIIGSTAGIKVSGVYNANNVVAFTLNFGGVTYNSGFVNLATANTSRTLTFTNPGDSGGTIAVNLNKYAIPASQGNVDTIAAAIQDDLDGLTIYQQRAFSTSSTSGIPSTKTAGTILDGIGGTDFRLYGKSFNTNTSSADVDTAPVIGTFKVTAETSTTNGQISTTVGGTTYKTEVTAFDSGSSNIKTLNFNSYGAGKIRLYKDGDATTNPNDYLQIDVATNTTISGFGINSAEGANLVQDALNKAVGNGSSGALEFQVGASTSDTISIGINSVKTTDIYKDDSDVVQSLDIGTQTGAQTAIQVLDNAIQSVISRRADVGAAQSRFSFAQSNLEVSISNQDSARGNFLDADVATESTAFASAQVKLQASTAVLAQANQLPSQLLRLLQ